MPESPPSVDSTDAAAPSWRTILSELSAIDWTYTNARPALRCLPAFLMVLGFGLWTGRLQDSAVLAAAAMSVGFGSFQALGNSRPRIMFLVTVAISISALTGALGSRSLAGVIATAAGWAFAYGMLTAWQSGLTWVGLQCVIIGVISSGYPVPAPQAVNRALLTLAGGLLQSGVILAIWRIFGPPREPVAGPPATLAIDPPTGSHLATLRLHWSPRSPVGRYALQLGFTLLVAACAYRLLSLPNGYWVPMTAVLVLKPEFRQTFVRGVARLAGTLIGVGLATLLAATLRPGPDILCALIIVFAWGSYTLFRVNYGLFAICITAYVVFLLALLGLPETTVVWYRTLNTALGGVIALSAYLLPLSRFESPARE